MRTASPPSRCSTIRRCTNSIDPTSRPRVGWLAIRSLCSRPSSLARMTFCWLPPDSEPAGRAADGVRTSNSAIRSSAFFAIAGRCRLMPEANGGRSYMSRMRFSATENGPTRPSSVRSSGTYATPASSRCRGVAWVRSRPFSVMLPPAMGRSPISASHSSVCPLPCTPAMPRISPARTWKDIPFTQTRPSSPVTVSLSTSRTVPPGFAGVLLTRSCTFLPTMSDARSSAVASGARSPTTAPRRSTVIVSAIAWTSLSLCEMKMTDVPPSRSWRTMRNSSSVSAGVSTAVGSSRISTLAWRTSALTISTRC